MLDLEKTQKTLLNLPTPYFKAATWKHNLYSYLGSLRFVFRGHNSQNSALSIVPCCLPNNVRILILYTIAETYK